MIFEVPNLLINLLEGLLDGLLPTCLYSLFKPHNKHKTDLALAIASRELETNSLCYAHLNTKYTLIIQIKLNVSLCLYQY